MVIKQISNIKQLRIEKELSQEQLSESSGVSLRTIQRLESGETIGREKTLKKIADALNVNYKEISYPEDSHSLEEKKIKQITISLIIAKIIVYLIIGGCIGAIIGYYFISRDLITIVMILFAALGAIIPIQQNLNKIR